MSAFTVRCRNAAGTPRTLAILAHSSARATTEALRQLNADYPNEGWLAEWVL